MVSSSSTKATIVSVVGKSARVAVSFTVICALLLVDSPLPLYYVTMAVLTSLLGKIVKLLARQPRPALSPKKGYGMPSSHTTAITFFGLVIIMKAPLLISNYLLRYCLNIAIVLYSGSAW